ncbi:hypothetical protein EDC01DRAFT_679212 [Geopyxis carbonaria]|nr:hypothetical protein EDC01DRAFT_679212 [Geopyxis carbonaria]
MLTTTPTPGPCKIVGPVVEKFSADDEFADKADFYKIDVDQLQSVAAEQGVSAMPTFLLFKDGEKIATVLGANPKRLREEIVAAVAKCTNGLFTLSGTAMHTSWISLMLL